MKNSKLVRDNMHEILRGMGITPNIRVASQEEFEQKLKQKLQEEVDEYLKDSNPDELADILEVIYSLCEVHNMSKQDLEITRKKKEDANGAFKHKYISEWDD